MALLGVSIFYFISGANIFVALGIGAALVMMTTLNMPISSIGQLMMRRLEMYTMLAMPLFMLAGNLLLQGGGVKKFIDFFDAWIGHFRGGLLMAATGFCIFFAAMTGSGYATIAAVGSIMCPEMKKAGYSDATRGGLIACAGQLGNLIPPSISMIVIGALTERSVATLFAAGLVPGVLIGFGIMGVGIFIARREGVAVKERSNWKTRWVSLFQAIPSIIMPIIILGGIYTGAFTPTEAAAVSVLYSILIGVLIYGGLRSWTKIKAGFNNAARSAVMVYVIMAGVSLFGFVVSRSGLGGILVNFILDTGMGRLGIVVILNVALLGLGFFISPFTLLYLAIPVLAPVAGDLGISLIWIGVLWLMNALVGAITPPMAAALYIAARVAEVEPGRVFRGALPFLAVWVVVLFLVVFIPDVALWLPKAMGMPGDYI